MIKTGEYTQLIDMNAVVLELVWKFEINIEEQSTYQPGCVQLLDIYLDSAIIPGYDKEIWLDEDVEKCYESKAANVIRRDYEKYIYRWEV